MSMPLLPPSPIPTLPHVSSHRHILIPARVGGDGHTQLKERGSAFLSARAKGFGLGGCRLYIPVFVVTKEMCMFSNNCEAPKGSLGIWGYFISFLKTYIVKIDH